MKTTWRPLLPRPRRSPRTGASRPSLPFKAKLMTTPPRRDTRRSSPRRVSSLKPSTEPTLMSRSTSLSGFCLLLAGPVSVDLTKPRPSKASPRSVTRSAPSLPRSAFSVALSPSESAKVGKFAEMTSPEASTSTVPFTPPPAPSTPGPSHPHVFEPRPCRLADKREGRAARPPRRLQPSRQQIVDLGLREVGLDGETAIGVICRNAPVELDRHRPGERAAEIEAKLAAR